MSLLSEAMIFERYGPRLDTDALAGFLGMGRSSLLNAISAERCPVPTYVDGARRFADFRDVAAHLDACRERAT